MSEEHITIAERIRRIVKASAAALSTREIYAADDNFENIAQVAGQMSPFLARGEFIGTKGEGGRIFYSQTPGYVPLMQGVRGPAKATTKAIKTAAPAPVVVTPKPAKQAAPPREDPPPKLPADDDENESGDDVEFFISAGGWLSIQVGDDSVMIDPKHIGRLNKFTDATSAIWGRA